MQSSSSGMLSALGLLACAVVAGMFAAKKWPQGPPRDLPLRAWDWVAGQVAPPMAQSEARDYGPAPQFDATPRLEAHAAPDGLAPPAVEIPQPSPPLETERAAPGQLRPVPFSIDAHPASNPSRTLEPGPPQPPRDEPPKTAPFWPTDLADLLPGLGTAPGTGSKENDARSPASLRSRASNPSAAADEPRPEGSIPAGSIEQLMRRLEQMGAVVVRLERQRGAAAGYLFRCELPLPQNPRYHRFFQAADAEPARAIQRVTREVEAWKASGRR